MNKSAWKTEDKEWMKQRRKDWGYIKKRLYKISHLKKGDINKFLKSYFLKGCMPLEDHKAFFWQEYNPEKPLCCLEMSVLLECWLNPDQSEENWAYIRKIYSDHDYYMSRMRFLELSKNIASSPREYYLEEGDYFGGLEERLYCFLCLTRCRRENYLDQSDEKFYDNIVVWRVYDICAGLNSYFESEFSNASLVVHYRLQELHDALQVAPHAIQELPAMPVNLEIGKDGLIKAIDRILAHPTHYMDVMVERAEQVLDVLLSPELPAEVSEYVADVRSKSRSLEEQVIYSANASLFFFCPSLEVRDRLIGYLAPGDRPSIPNDDYDIYGELYSFRWPCLIRQQNEIDVYLEIDLGVRGETEIESLASVANNARCGGLYGYFDNPERDPAYYKIIEDGKLVALYMQGDDAELDAKIATYESPREALPLVVEEKI